MAVLLIIILIIIIFILAVICIHRSAKINSLKDQVEFLEYSLEQLTEKGNRDKEDSASLNGQGSI